MKRLILPFFLLQVTSVLAQSGLKHSFSLGMQGYLGSFVTNLPKAQYVRDSYTSFVELNAGWQTDGSKPWQLANGLPQLGVGMFYGNTGSRQYMGHMAGLFSYIHLPLFRCQGLQSKLRIAGGLGWVEKPYDITTNHKGVLIGSYINAYIQFLWLNEFRLAEGIYANAGINFSHLSNGSTMLPNLGLNVPSLSVGLRWGAAPPSMQKTSLSFNRRFFYSVYTAAGVKQFPWIRGERFLVNLMQAEAARRFNYSNSYGAGMALFYDRSLEVDPSGILTLKRKGNKLQAGVYLSYEHFFGKLSLPVQLGGYVYNRDIYAALFQQVGLRYRINNHWKLQFLMKTHSGKADFLHLGVGYQIQK